MDKISQNREFFKADFEILKQIKTDKQKGIPAPSFQKEYNPNSELIELPSVDKDILVKPNILDCINDRRSVRKYGNEKITLAELSYLLWATQGIQTVKDKSSVLRTVPSAGCTHPFETYLIINNVENLKCGVYRYLPLEHKLLLIKSLNNVDDAIDKATPNQPFVQGFVSKSAVVFAWSCIPYRSEHKFNITAHKKILIDIGHVCQNLYIASESLNHGTCAIGIYDQDIIDNMLDLDGVDEFVIYMACVGKKL
ncbi:SagB/ThcOx family dehydrogenase [Paraclostridium sordellii]|uniref:SagB/ThcOx family dehydrogenase n=1 Tax=Paraclostridium sordellii TaxID=1505 RepID=UPI0005E23A81|nr:SagB/ThcOx family dehydrogenase [Paeniclostridium sordellii]CEQ20129.1 SagB-type dehydrogenase domain-containing protein [[Clostridium] sordellii] [Paeniclostridium sordellii]